MKIERGQECQDIITGFKGIVNSFVKPAVKKIVAPRIAQEQKAVRDFGGIAKSVAQGFPRQFAEIGQSLP